MARNSIARSRDARDQEESRNPSWFVPVMLGFIVVGLLWVVVFYISGSTLPIASIGPWNIAIGFGIMFVGFIMTTKWK
ncbi:cell division protein CrgA [Agrococcus sp. SGAir0287]|uniref:cell division protein CrgA n=1 Tax=Agrococcus sp. SGAir0287 TaxID=2070347 RepID=UPI0010CD27D9|nr:cell division protein CrgA [Agrococcus sp. SGAir0287]QCR18045.1 septation inhibitor protein [Agrococcus sp. SGAir0287]